MTTTEMQEKTMREYPAAKFSWSVTHFDGWDFWDCYRYDEKGDKLPTVSIKMEA